MNIVYFCSDPGVDPSGLKGASIHVRSFTRALHELDHEVTTVASKVNSPESYQALTGCPALAAPLAPGQAILSRGIKAGGRLLGGLPGRGRNLVRMLHVAACRRVLEKTTARLQPGFIYERYSLWGTAGLHCARRRSIPLVLEVNAPLVAEEQIYRAGFAIPALARRVEHRIWRAADLLIGVSEVFRGHFEKAGVAAERVRILPNAVDPALFQMAPAQAVALRQQLHLNDRFVVGFAGSFKVWHGVDFLLKTFARLRGQDASCHLLLVGDGPMRSALEDAIRQLGLTEAVTLVGAVPHEQVPSYLAVMDVAVAPYPSVDDFYFSPLKLYEYMAAGRAIVASHIGQVAEAITDGRTGLLYKPGDGEGLLDCLQRLHDDAALRKTLGENARQAGSVNTWRQSAARVVSWVEPLLDRTAG